MFRRSPLRSSKDLLPSIRRGPLRDVLGEIMGTGGTIRALLDDDDDDAAATRVFWGVEPF